MKNSILKKSFMFILSLILILGSFVYFDSKDSKVKAAEDAFIPLFVYPATVSMTVSNQTYVARLVNFDSYITYYRSITVSASTAALGSDITFSDEPLYQNASTLGNNYVHASDTVEFLGLTKLLVTDYQVKKTYDEQGSYTGFTQLYICGYYEHEYESELDTIISYLNSTKNNVNNISSNMNTLVSALTNQQMVSMGSQQSYTLLWSNSDISQAFTSQSITLSSTNFETIYIYYRWVKDGSGTGITSNDKTWTFCQVLPGDFSSGLLEASYANYSDNQLKTISRPFTRSGSNLSFDYGYYRIGTNSTVRNNNFAVPYKIYGITTDNTAANSIMSKLTEISSKLNILYDISESLDDLDPDITNNLNNDSSDGKDKLSDISDIFDSKLSDVSDSLDYMGDKLSDFTSQQASIGNSNTSDLKNEIYNSFHLIKVSTDVMFNSLDYAGASILYAIPFILIVIIGILL